MKFWEFMSVSSYLEVNLKQIEFASEWAYIRSWIADYKLIVVRQDREKLDALVPTGLCEAAFVTSDKDFYVHDGVLRTRPWGMLSKRLSALETYRRYGGDCMEEAIEFGSVEVDR